ncbi:MAG: tRNA (adenosine(37)-N6)-threonylcarbamoyltransferase complex transferase subunit TsaD [Chlorobiota bacterium]|jgi:N6-L-threonylcarbamoyladenine synthase|nr:MAG: tRNA (adenosine(37)-N6)-threonylcarbamoyltransferase complex transferase subunit TsaD [Chlorobiota bacterium]
MGYRILAIETSCDETAAAVIAERKVLSNVIASQHEHQRWGGIVPEIASRAHLERIWFIANQALAEAGLEREQLDAIACTVQPGLAGSLFVGANFAKGLALGLRRACVPVHHLEGHILSGFLADPALELPAVVLVASGGHTLLVLLESEAQYRVLGSTRDDAAGEAFDKIATLLGLGYPGGPALEQLARSGSPDIPLPRPLLSDPRYEFSFSGLKTAVRRYLAEHPPQSDADRARIAASAQAAIVDVLVAKTQRAANEYGARSIVLAGGVAANTMLQHTMRRRAQQRSVRVIVPERQYVLDNAAMIGLVAHIKLELRGTDAYRTLDFTIDPTPWRMHRHGSNKHARYEDATFSL